MSFSDLEADLLWIAAMEQKPDPNAIFRFLAGVSGTLPLPQCISDIADPEAVRKLKHAAIPTAWIDTYCMAHDPSGSPRGAFVRFAYLLSNLPPR